MTLLAALGLWTGPAARERWLVALYFLVFFGIQLLFYAGSYNYGADVRYSLMTYPPLAVLGGLGAARVARWGARLVPARPAAAIVAALVVIPLTILAGLFVWLKLTEETDDEEMELDDVV